MSQMQTIKQGDDKLCVACCVAMLLRLPLDEILEHARLEVCHELFTSRRMSLAEAARLLACYDYALGFVLKPEGIPPNDLANAHVMSLNFDFKSHDALLTVSSLRLSGHTHAVVWDSESQCIRDPSPITGDRCKIQDFQILEWMPLCSVKETKPTTPESSYDYAVSQSEAG